MLKAKILSKSTSYFAILALIAILFASCIWGKSPYYVDVTNIKADLKIKRFDRDVQKLDLNNFNQGVQELEKKYPKFYPVFKTEVFGWNQKPNTKNDSLFAVQFNTLMSDPYVQEVYDSVQNHFGDFSPYEAELEKAFKHFKYYFPNRQLPEVVTFVSNFTYASFTIDSSILAIGLDMFLGDTFKYYKSVFPEYLTQTLKPEYLTANCMNVVGSMVYDATPDDNKLISAMIAAGKELHFVDRMMPSAPDYVKIGYTPEKLQWCKDNEAQIWNFFVEKDLLFNTNQAETGKLMSPGPFTAGMPPASPGKIGVWVGWQIVRRFMLNNPDVTLDELMTQYSAQSILQGSKYKPTF